MDPTVILNLIFALIIVILGYWVFRTKKMVLSLYVALAFGLFAVSHLAILMGIPSTDLSIILTRSLGYLVVIYALIRELM